MQPDFSKMAQGQAAPQEQKMSPEQGKAELEKAYDEAGMPKGDTVEAIKQRVLKVLEEVGFLKKLTPQGLKELTQKISEFAKLAKSGDIEALKEHPITKILNQIQLPQQQQAAPQQPAAPTNFAGMVKPPMGGGMSGS